MEMKKLQNQKGFTLVEIAIVLVIIGLLLGGVLKGQELIENAKVKSLNSEFDNVTAAYYAYKDRTSSFPDTSNDNAFWFALKQEGFISGDLGTSSASPGPIHGYDGSFFVEVGGGTTLKDGKAYICAGNVPNDVAQNIDTKSDDGTVDSGTYRGVTNADPVEDDTKADYADEGNIGLCKEL